MSPAQDTKINEINQAFAAIDAILSSGKGNLNGFEISKMPELFADEKKQCSFWSMTLINKIKFIFGGFRYRGAVKINAVIEKSVKVISELSEDEAKIYLATAKKTNGLIVTFLSKAGNTKEVDILANASATILTSVSTLNAIDMQPETSWERNLSKKNASDACDSLIKKYQELNNSNNEECFNMNDEWIQTVENKIADLSKEDQNALYAHLEGKLPNDINFELTKILGQNRKWLVSHLLLINIALTHANSKKLFLEALQEANQIKLNSFTILNKTDGQLPEVPLQTKLTEFMGLHSTHENKKFYQLLTLIFNPPNTQIHEDLFSYGLFEANCFTQDSLIALNSIKDFKYLNLFKFCGELYGKDLKKSLSDEDEKKFFATLFPDSTTPNTEKKGVFDDFYNALKFTLSLPGAAAERSFKHILSPYVAEEETDVKQEGFHSRDTLTLNKADWKNVTQGAGGFVKGERYLAIRDRQTLKTNECKVSLDLTGLSGTSQEEAKAVMSFIQLIGVKFGNLSDLSQEVAKHKQNASLESVKPNDLLAKVKDEGVRIEIESEIAKLPQSKKMASLCEEIQHIQGQLNALSNVSSSSNDSQLDDLKRQEQQKNGELNKLSKDLTKLLAVAVDFNYELTRQFFLASLTL